MTKWDLFKQRIYLYIDIIIYEKQKYVLYFLTTIVVLISLFCIVFKFLKMNNVEVFPFLSNSNVIITSETEVFQKQVNKVEKDITSKSTNKNRNAVINDYNAIKNIMIKEFNSIRYSTSNKE